MVSLSNHGWCAQPSFDKLRMMAAFVADQKSEAIPFFSQSP